MPHVKKTYMGELASKVPVGVWNNIDNFSLTAAAGSYRTKDHVYRMYFVQNTLIKEPILKNDDNFLNMVDFQTIVSGKPNTYILVGMCLLV